MQMPSSGTKGLVGHAQNLVVVLSHDAASLEGLASERVTARQATAGSLYVSTQACHVLVPIALEHGGVREGKARGFFVICQNKPAAMIRLHVQQHSCPSCPMEQASQPYSVYLD